MNCNSAFHTVGQFAYLLYPIQRQLRHKKSVSVNYMVFRPTPHNPCDVLYMMTVAIILLCIQIFQQVVNAIHKHHTTDTIQVFKKQTNTLTIKVSTLYISIYIQGQSTSPQYTCSQLTACQLVCWNNVPSSSATLLYTSSYYRKQTLFTAKSSSVYQSVSFAL